MHRGQVADPRDERITALSAENERLREDNKELKQLLSDAEDEEEFRIKQLRSENERLRAEQKTSLSASILKDAERWRKVRPQLYVYYNSGTEHWQLCMVDGGISGHADYFPTVEQAIDEALKDGS